MHETTYIQGMRRRLRIARECRGQSFVDACTLASGTPATTVQQTLGWTQTRTANALRRLADLDLAASSGGRWFLTEQGLFHAAAADVDSLDALAVHHTLRDTAVLLHVLKRIESGERAKILVGTVASLATAFSMHLEHLLVGWPGWLDGIDPPYPPKVIVYDPAETTNRVRLTLRRLRLERAMSTVRLGREASLPQSTVFRYEQGTYVLPLDAVEALTRALGVPFLTAFGLEPMERTADVADQLNDAPVGAKG